MLSCCKSLKCIFTRLMSYGGTTNSSFPAVGLLVVCCTAAKLHIRFKYKYLLYQIKPAVCSNYRSELNFALLSCDFSSGLSSTTKNTSVNNLKMDDEIPCVNSHENGLQIKKTNVTSYVTLTTIGDDEKSFNDLFPVLLEDLTAAGLADSETFDAFRWFKQVNEYNVPHGKKNRGLTVVHSYRYLTGDLVTGEGLLLSSVLGWCIEWLQAFFLVADDVMDSSVTRRGQPCWYKLDGVGLKAVNDAFYLESAIYAILRKYFRTHPSYADIFDLFHETTLQTIVGQNLDLVTAPCEGVDFTGYNIERYNAIVKHKTAYYSFYLPVACAMHLAGVKEEQSFLNASSILIKMGEYFQIQDDYLDCYGDPEVTGKIGTDIEDNKCSWLIVQALRLANKEQRIILEDNYGCHDAKKVSRVKSVYEELDLQDVYTTYEDQSYRELMELIDTLSGSLPNDMFRVFAQKIYKRQK